MTTTTIAQLDSHATIASSYSDAGFDGDEWRNVIALFDAACAALGRPDISYEASGEVYADHKIQCDANIGAATLIDVHELNAHVRDVAYDHACRGEVASLASLGDIAGVRAFRKIAAPAHQN